MLNPETPMYKAYSWVIEDLEQRMEVAALDSDDSRGKELAAALTTLRSIQGSAASEESPAAGTGSAF
jgi:hypothetical protein